MKRIAILQSNYLPWKGYFDLIRAVDEFVLYDSVQYTKNDWRNRNQIKTAAGKRWLTVPVRHESSEQAIDAVAVADRGVFRKHWTGFRQAYARAACISHAERTLLPLFEQAASLAMLSQVNEHFIRGICALLGISTTITRSTDYALAGDRNERLVSLCRQSGATGYVSGPAARAYLDEAMFADAGIRVSWADYSGYPEYPQPHPPFDHGVSIIDLIACMGEDATGFLSEVAA